MDLSIQERLNEFSEKFLKKVDSVWEKNEQMFFISLSSEMKINNIMTKCADNKMMNISLSIRDYPGLERSNKLLEEFDIVVKDEKTFNYGQGVLILIKL